MKTISKRQLLITFIPATVVLVAVALANLLFQANMAKMTRDPTTIAGIHSLTGILSNLGILLWCATASICAFVASTLRTINPGETFWFLRSSALMTAYLLFDDFFLFHDFLAPKYLGLNEKVIYAVLGIAVSAYLVVFRRVILQTNFGVLIVAVGFLATSVFIDAILEPLWLWRHADWKYFYEDGAKFLGIAGWCSYYAHTSHQIYVSTFGQENQVKDCS